MSKVFCTELMQTGRRCMRIVASMPSTSVSESRGVFASRSSTRLYDAGNSACSAADVGRDGRLAFSANTFGGLQPFRFTKSMEGYGLVEGTWDLR